MIIDIHGHFTQVPDKLRSYRASQIRTQNRPARSKIKISDDELRAALKGNIDAMADRGIDRVLFSPQASAMGHQFGSALISQYWTEANNDLIDRSCRLSSGKLLPVCQLPQSPGNTPADWLPELERCVKDMGFVGCNVNPDISGGVAPLTPSIGSDWWYPLWEKMVELDVPGMIHASATLNPALHLNGSHYLNVDTAAAFDLCFSDVFRDFPTLKLIVPHGGGAIPYHYNRCRALHALNGRAPFEEVVKHLYFDTTLYDIESIVLLVQKIGADNILYSSEMFGTGKAIDPGTGCTFDDTVHAIQACEQISQEDKDKIFEHNAKKLYSRAKWDGQ